MNDVTLSLTPQEVQATLQLIDSALRHSGASVLPIASVLSAKLTQAVQQQQQQSVNRGREANGITMHPSTQ
jgi:hypothetical protein